MPIDQALLDHANQVATKAGEVGAKLSLEADREQRWRLMARTVNVVVGVLAAVIALVPSVSAAVGDAASTVVFSIAGVVLVADTIVPLVLHRDSPELIRVYAYYVGSYETKIHNTIADASLTIDRKQLKLQAWLQLAGQNLDDIRARWPRWY